MADVMRLGIILSATDKMSRVIDQAVGKSTQKLNSFQKRASAIGGGMQKAGLGMVAAGTAIAGSMFAITQKVAEGSKELVRTAAKVGMSVEEWQKIGFAAKYSGIDADKFRLSLQKLQKQQFEASKGNQAALKNFKLMGLSVKDASGQLKPANVLFSELSDKFAKAPNGPAKTAMAMKLFGRTGADLIPLLNKGSEGIEELRKQAEKTGNVLSGENIVALKKYNEHIKLTKIQLEGMKTQLAIAVLPVLEKFTKKITEVGTAIIEWINKHKQLFETILKVTAVVGGLLIVLGTANLIIGTVLKSFTLFNAVMALSKSSMFLFKIQYYGLIAAQKIGIVWTAAVTAAQWLWNAAMSANPIGLIILGVAALGTGLYFLVKHWDTVTASMKKFGAYILSGVLRPIIWVLEAIGKLTGAKWAINMAANLTAFKSKMDITASAPTQSRAAAAVSSVSNSRMNTANSNQSNIHYSPTIQINGNGVTHAGIANILNDDKKSFSDKLKEYDNRYKRLSYAQ